MMKRIIFDLVILGAIFYAPWWVVVPVSFVGAFWFSAFYEIFIFGLLMDLLYASQTSSFYGIIGVTSSAIIFFLARQAKDMIRPSY